MKIIKPMTLALLHKPYRQFGENRLVVATLGFFRLGGDGNERRLLTENLQWPELLKALPEGFPLDEVMPKAQPEVLAATTAYAPGGEAVESMECTIAVGDATNGVAKRLRVSGEREWLYGLVPLYQVTRPVPFKAMPMDWRRAYGGEGHPANPEGRGYVGHRFSAFVGQNQGVMPNVEYPHAPTRGHAKASAPAGFGPIDPRCQPRAGKLGTYDKQWLENDHPGLPRDLRWEAFNRAPEDQWLGAPLTGGEPYRIEGLHPTLAVIEGEIPRLRHRAFIRFEGEASDQCREIPLAMDTLWLFPDRRLGVVVQRGQIVVEDSDALDVASLMAAYEHTDDTPRGLDHYQRVQALRLDPETAAAHALNEAQLAPELDAAEAARRAAEQQAAEEAFLADNQALLDELEADFWAEAPADAELIKPADYTPPKAELPPMGLIPQAAIERGELDLSAYLANAEALAEAAAEQADAEMKAAEARLAKELPEVPADEKEAADRLAEAKAAAEKRATTLNAEAAQLQEVLALAEQSGQPVDPEQRAQAEQGVAEALAQQRKGRRTAPNLTVELPAEEHAAAVGAHLGRWVAARIAAGEPLSGRELIGADLRGLDLSGLDLSGILLEGAELSRVSFSGANLSGAVLTAARIEGADFSGADLSEANLSLCAAAGARFTGARLDHGLAAETDLSGADLSHASLSHWSTQRATLDDASLDGAELSHATLLQVSAKRSRWHDAHGFMATLMECDLSEAELSGVRLERCALPALKGERSGWQGAVLERCFFGPGCRLTGARFSATRATLCNWRDADLSGADLTGGTFAQCDFGLADLTNARLRDALLYRAMLMQSTLDGCDAEGVDLFHALARKASFRDARLDRANLVRAEVSEARFDGASLRDIQPKALRKTIGRAA